MAAPMTTEAKQVAHTPGPWHVEACEQCPERGRIYIHAAGWLDPNELIAEAVKTDRDVDNGTVDEAEANARLIAAAPDLLEFAQWVLEMDPESKAPLFERARGALAKAGAA